MSLSSAPSVHLTALGCRVNEAELEQWAAQFAARGIQLSSDPAQADLLVINTCAVTGEAARKSRQILRRSHRSNPRARLVISGCYASLAREQVSEIPGVDLLIDNSEKDMLVERACQLLDVTTMPAQGMEADASMLFERGRQRAFVKVQDGCRHRCSFCIVTVARGSEVSRTPQDILAQIRALTDTGIQEIVLTGVHIGGYGADIDHNLLELIDQILERTDVQRLRLGSLEPWDLPEGFFERFSNPRLMPHLHLPLQSGCDATLKRMARRCRTQAFADIVSQARAAHPQFNITTDIIAGFPGETEEHWRESMAFVEQMQFGDLHVFTYSARAGTGAAAMPDQIPVALRRERAKALIAQGAIARQQFLNAQLGKELEVLWERPEQTHAGDDGQLMSGYSSNYVRILSSALKAPRSNEITSITPRKIAPDGRHLLA